LYLASAPLTMSRLWAVAVVLSVVRLEGASGLAFLITDGGATIAIGTGWRCALRLSRRRR
jgi:hypothetical protein